MRVEIRGPRRSGVSRSPGYIFRKWVVIGAVAGAVLVASAGALVLGIAMIGGAIFGSVLGAVVGVIKALIAIVRR